jgi:hypothetical protein
MIPWREELFRRVRGIAEVITAAEELFPKTFSVALGPRPAAGPDIVIIMAFLLTGIGGGMLVGYITTAKPISASMLTTSTETTHIKDSSGQDVAILTGSQNINREYVSFSAIKKTYIDEAFKAIEDERFDEHFGIAILRRLGSAIISALDQWSTATHGVLPPSRSRPSKCFVVLRPAISASGEYSGMVPSILPRTAAALARRDMETLPESRPMGTAMSAFSQRQLGLL